jgi:hypothetical protein
MKRVDFLERIKKYIDKQLVVFDLEGRKKLEESKDLVTYTANIITTTPKTLRRNFIILGVVLFCFVFGTLLILFKPISENNQLKINRENFIALEENPTNKDMEFKLNIPTAIKWNNQFYFFDKKNNDGTYNAKLYFYAYQSGVFNRQISDKPILITKEFDYKTPSVENVKLDTKYNNLNSSWSFESDDDNPFVYIRNGGVETLIFDPKASFQENKCKQEKVNSNIKYTCPITFSKEESIEVSAWIKDKVGNKADVLNNTKTSYVEPMKVNCTQPPSKVRSESVSIKCKTNRQTFFTINGAKKDSIEANQEKTVPLLFDLSQSSQQEFQYILSFEDPNGTPIELSYKIFKDNTPPTIEFVATTVKSGAIYTIRNEIKEASETAKIELNFDQASSPSPNWYYKYPENKVFDLTPSGTIPLLYYTSEFKLCGKDPITNTETCVGAYSPSLVSYNLKVTDDVGNQSNYNCTHQANASLATKCNKY